MAEGPSLEEATNEEDVVVAEAVDAPAVYPETDLPDDPAAALPLVLDRLHAAEADAAELVDHLQRKQAELENFRKRVARTSDELRTQASRRIVEAMLPVLDSFDVAFEHDPQTPTEEKLIAGMRSTYALIFEILRKEGLQPIEAEGQTFDPELHEAVSAPSEGEGTLVVSQELRRGYRLGDKVLRPALVAVAYA